MRNSDIILILCNTWRALSNNLDIPNIKMLIHFDQSNLFAIQYLYNVVLFHVITFRPLQLHLNESQIYRSDNLGTSPQNP